MIVATDVETMGAVMIVKTYDVFCDGVLGQDPDGEKRYCPTWAGGASTTESAALARAGARRLGWARRAGRDLCPECVEAGR